MADYEDVGNCFGVKNATFLAALEEAFSPGTPFSAFLLAVEICLCLMFFLSIPNTRKDPIFWFLAIVFAPYLVNTCVEVVYFVSIYFYTASYTFWSWVHDSVIGYCYTSFLFNFQFGFSMYSGQIIYAVVKKKVVSKSATRWPYILIFFITLVQSWIFWQIMSVGVFSALLILFIAPICILTTLCVVLCRKSDKDSEHEVVRHGNSRLLWNVPCLLLTMADMIVELYLNFRENAYKTTAVKNKGYLFPVLFPTIVIICMYLTLPALRRAIFPCCYNKNDNDTNSDQVFLLTRSGSANSSPAPSERSSINAITNQPVITYPNNSVVPYPNNAVVPYNPDTSPYTVVPMPQMYYQGFGQGYPPVSSQNYPQGQPIYFPVPITFYNPALVQNRTNDLPAVQ